MSTLSPEQIAQYAHDAGPADTGGFRVDPDVLTGYARRARAVADELGTLRTGALRDVRALADDGFGRIGGETGFTDALDRFGGALRHQLRGIGHDAEILARSVARTARHHRAQEDEIAVDLLRLLRDR